MNRFSNLLFIYCLSLIVSNNIYSQEIENAGADITAFTIYGEKVNGELFSVREKSLLIFNSSNCEDLSKKWECINQVKSENIEKLLIRGESNVLLGGGLGLVVALVTGILIFNANYDSGSFVAGVKAWDESATAIILSTVVSLGVGIGIGIATSTPDEVLEPFSDYDISGLSIYAKYPYEEPEELKIIE